MFKKRFITALVFGVIVLSVIQKGGLWLFSALAIVFVVISAYELFNLLKLEDRLPIKIAGITIVLLSTLTSFNPELLIIPLSLAILFPFFYEILKRKPESAIISVTSVIFGTIYIGYLFGYHLIKLRQLQNGKDILILLLSIAWSSDVFAYLLGRKFGKHKVIPAISPGKSLEGFLSGIVFGVVSALIICYIFDFELKHGVILGMGLTILGQIGDLSESLLKRSAGVKDSGKLMPGHGGVLDRCDSLMFMTPALYYYVTKIMGMD